MCKAKSAPRICWTFCPHKFRDFLCIGYWPCESTFKQGSCLWCCKRERFCVRLKGGGVWGGLGAVKLCVWVNICVGERHERERERESGCWLTWIKAHTQKRGGGIKAHREGERGEGLVQVPEVSTTLTEREESQKNYRSEWSWSRVFMTQWKKSQENSRDYIYNKSVYISESGDKT